MLLLDNILNCKVTGVYADMPQNSHFRSDILISMKTQRYEWGNFLGNNHYTYLVLNKDAAPSVIESKFEEVVQNYLSPQAQAVLGSGINELRQSGNYVRYSLMPLTRIHLHSSRGSEISPNGSIQYVYIFSAIALFILSIACINFMNLSTARSANRAKEVGIRKVLGSLRGQLMGQFFTESVVVVGFAMIIGLVLLFLILPLFNDIAHKDLTINSLLNWKFVALLLTLPFVVGFLAGSYPAIFLSGFQPIRVLKGKMGTNSRDPVRNGLVVFQFMTSLVLIVSTMVIYQQLQYIQNKELGFNKNQVLIVHDAYALNEKTETFKNEVKRLPNVVNGTMSGYLPVESYRSNSPLFQEGILDQTKMVTIQNWLIDYDYIPTLNMEVVQGRNFSQDFGTDSTAVILNETAVRKFGFKDPIGKRISQLELNMKDIKTYTVVGVIKDFHFESLRSEISALLLKLGRNQGLVSFKIKGDNITATLAQVENQWKAMSNGQPFNYSFMDADFDKMYRTERRVGTIAFGFAMLSILIACLGLFGLAAFMAEQRTKEIGIRKVLGASVLTIVRMLSADFLKLVMLSTLIAFPIAYYFMSKWLEDFAYRTTISVWVFVAAGAVAILIAFLTVSFQTIKAAVANPVKSLRTE
jgi:putative ABC transport system permease protein